MAAMARSYACLLLLVGWATGAAARAQFSGGSAAIEFKRPTVFADPASLDDKAPYSTWKTHAASRPEEAIVLIRHAVIGGGVDTVTGLAVRCDGFILVPRPMRDAAYRNESVEAILEHADGLATGSSATVRAIAHPHILSSLGCALLKINGYHIPGLPLLAASNVATGMSVRLLCATPRGAADTADTASPAYSVAVSNAVVGARGAQRDSFALTRGEGDAPVPAGTVVVDAQSGAAIGMVTEGAASGAGASFTTFARLHTISSEVALAPERAAVRLGDQKGAAPSSSPGSPGMVWIPGGPTHLAGEAAYQFQRRYGTDVVCTPGFYADIDPVSNAQYRTWLATSDRRFIHPLPPGWGTLELQEPKLRNDLPACGMSAGDAEAFAADRGARLLTEAEWYRARRVTEVAWAQHADDQRSELAWQVFHTLKDWNSRAFQATVDAAIAMVNIRRDPPTTLSVPPADRGSFEALYQAIDSSSRSEKWFWRSVHPIGIYPEDVNQYKLRDIVTNPVELLQASQYEASVGAKPAPAEIDPLFTDFQWTASGMLDPEGERRFFLRCFLLLVWHNEWQSSWAAGGKSITLSIFMANLIGHSALIETLDKQLYISLKSGDARAGGNYTYMASSNQAGMASGIYQGELTTFALATFRCAR